MIRFLSWMSTVVTLAIFVAILFIDHPMHALFVPLSENQKTFFTVFTTLGDGALWLIPTFLGILFFSLIWRNTLWRNRMVFLFANVALAGILVMLLKMLFGRYRPFMLDSQGLDGFTFFASRYELFSFPSGHTNTITAAMLSLLIFFPRLWWLWAFLILMGALSRVALSMHYLSDTIAGAYSALLVVMALYAYFTRRGLAL